MRFLFISSKCAAHEERLTVAVLAMALAGLTALIPPNLFAQSEPASSSIQGVWQVTEVATSGPNAVTNSSPQPGLHIFTARHYSVVTVNGRGPRPVLSEDLSNETAAQLLAVFGRSFTAQSGTYEVDGEKLTLSALVAKSPAAMAPGAFITASFKLDGKTLTITQDSNQVGPIRNPIKWKLTRIE
jgi:hypothetical protein